ncbi:DUF1295 domain-containing protein [Streptomyces sp. NPDC058751]|uniref:DUF1295 domain-containing protein n=1 Tax=Streptomyces sp. NPDC058751 TaxID=3346623 RepID=UPI003697C5E5
MRRTGDLVRRAGGHGENPRYEALPAHVRGSRNLYALRMVYLLQGALVWLVSLPVQAAQYTPRQVSTPERRAGRSVPRWAASIHQPAPP